MSLTQADPTKTGPMAAAGRPDRLRPSQAIRAAGLGLAYWFAGVLTIRLVGQAGGFGGAGSLAMFALAVVLGWPTVWMLKKAAALGPAQVVTGLAIATVAATVCDGTALTWWPWLYGSDAGQVLPGAAWLLWALGVFLLFAWFDSLRTPSAR